MLFGLLPLIYRNFLGWKPFAPVYYLRLFEIPIQIYGFGLGLAMMASQLGTTSYTEYIFPGLLVWMFWLTLTIEATYLTFMKAFSQRIWYAILTTPIRLHVILLAENLVALLKGLSLYLLLFPIGLWLGAIPSVTGYALALFPLIAYMIMITAFGHLLCSFARQEYDFDYIWPLFVGPMFTFSGIFFPTESLPGWIQIISPAFPMYHAVNAIRPLLLGSAEFWPVLGHTAVLLGMAAACLWGAHRRFKKRLLD